MGDLERGWPYVDKARDPWSSHRRIYSLLSSLPSGTRILDIGAATGILGRLCQGKGFFLRGIEPQQEWLALARPYYAEIYHGTLDSTPDTLLAHNDVVVCADVLEHLVDPLAALRRIVSLQRPGGTLIISVPNIANLWVRLHLLMGRFDYTDRGPLDRTHLHFFTRKTLLKLLKQAGLQVMQLQVTPVPLSLIHPVFTEKAAGKLAYRALMSLTALWPTLLGYQFIVETSKPVEE